MRSKTLEAMLRETPGFEVRSAGTHPHGNGRPITRTDLAWADRLVIFEPFHRRELLRRFFPLARTKPIVDFAIPDEYEAFDPALVALLKERFAVYFDVPLADPPEGARHTLAEEKLRGTIVAMEPLLEGGHQRGKMLVTYRDGSKAVFKPAHGEGRRRTVHVDDALASMRISLRPDEQRWFTNLVSAWGKEKVLRMWESLRLQLKWARNL